MLRVDNLLKTYFMGETTVEALRGVNLSVGEGEFVAIMGPSGSGKSTFMNILGCLDRPTSGKYYLDEIDTSIMDKDMLAAVRNSRIGFVFQGFNLLSRSTAFENVELPLYYGHVKSSEERRTRIEEALDSVGLSHRARHFPTQLSGGEQQRIAIARALVNKPSLLLADEPTGNLDSRTSDEIMGLLSNLNRNKSLTIVLVTHDRHVSEYAGRVVTFRDGRIIEDRPNFSPLKGGSP